DKCPPALLRGNTGPVVSSGTGITPCDLYCMIGNYNLRPNPVQSGNNSATQQVSDNAVFAFNTNYGLNNPLTVASVSVETNTGLAIVQNVAEKVTGTDPILIVYGDVATPHDSTNVIMWHNTLAGARLNIGYNETGTTAYYATRYSQRNNIIDEWN